MPQTSYKKRTLPQRDRTFQLKRETHGDIAQLIQSSKDRHVSLEFIKSHQSIYQLVDIVDQLFDSIIDDGKRIA